MIPGGVFASTLPATGAAGGGGLTVGLVVGIQLLLAAAILAGFAWFVRERRPGWASASRVGTVLVGLTGIVLVLGAVLGPSAGGSGTLVNPIPDTVTSVDAGKVIYEASCARCHGVDARGGGVDSGTTEIRPPSLTSGHLNAHSDADIYTWISNGLPGGMPAWSGTLSETDRWNLVNFLRGINGRGPSPAPSSGAGAPELAGFAVGGSLGLGLLGWLAAGFRRLRGQRRSRRRAGPRR